MKKTTRVKVNLPVSRLKELQKIAKLAGCSVNTVANVLLAKFIVESK